VVRGRPERDAVAIGRDASVTFILCDQMEYESNPRFHMRFQTPDTREKSLGLVQCCNDLTAHIPAERACTINFKYCDFCLRYSTF